VGQPRTFLSTDCS